MGQFTRFLCCFISLVLCFSACRKAATGKGPYQLSSHFADFTPPASPDYSRAENWSALPTRRDLADSVPAKSGQRDQQAEAVADVFFVYPTTYTARPKPEAVSQWNASLDNTSTLPI